MSHVAVLGMGAMGSRMAGNLVKAGHAVTAWNRSASKTASLEASGASIAVTPRSAVAEAEFVICMVRDDEASRRVWLDPTTGAMAGIRTSAVAIESSTVTVAWARELAATCQSRGVAFVDAPVLGSRPQAEAAQLIYVAGGEAAVVEVVRPILLTMGNAVHHAGTAGNGAALKLMINALYGVQVAAIGELLSLIKSLGVDDARAVDILAATAVCSPSGSLAAEKMLARNHTPLFPIELVEKDFRYVLHTAKAENVDVPLAGAAWRVYAEAIEQGYGDDNITGVAQLYA